MRVTFVANGCAIYEAHGYRVVSDPWLIDGAFEGSWCHFPPLRTAPSELAKLTHALYISHAHPDHYDERSLAAFARDIPIFILDQPPNILKRLLTKCGFTNVISSKSGAINKIGPFEIMLLKSFDAHHFTDASLENILDSSCLLTAGTVQVLNLNDNIPSLDTCKLFARQFPSLTLVQVQYTGASCYPSCFRNLSDADKLLGQENVRARYGKHFGDIAKVLYPKFIMPFAGQFVIGGKEWEKNRVLGTSSADYAGSWSRDIAPEVPVVLMNEGMSIDLPEGKLQGGPYRPLDLNDQHAYIRDHLAPIRYPYESLPALDASTDAATLHVLFEAAYAHFKKKQASVGYRSNCIMSFAFWDQCFECDLADGTSHFCSTSASVINSKTGRDFVQIYTDVRLLRSLLQGDVHWNNAMSGMHIEFFRCPEKYDPDLYMMLSYFHRQRAG